MGKRNSQLAVPMFLAAWACITSSAYSAEENISGLRVEETAAIRQEQVLPGDRQREVSYWPNGNIKEDKRYDDNGVLREEGFFRDDGTIENLKKYDALGNVTDEVNYSEEGRLMENADGWAAMTFEYRDGNMISESYYGDDGHLKERKLFDNEGGLLAKQYVGDGNIDPDEEYNPVPVLNKEQDNMYYDDEGRPEATTSVIRE